MWPKIGIFPPLFLLLTRSPFPSYRQTAEERLLHLAEQPDLLLRESSPIAAAARAELEALYAEVAAHEPSSSGGLAGPELFTENFDAEQIWYQVRRRRLW